MQKKFFWSQSGRGVKKMSLSTSAIGMYPTEPHSYQYPTPLHHYHNSLLGFSLFLQCSFD